MAVAKRLYLESLRVGDELPTLVKSAIDRVQIAQFAGACNDFNPMHVDEVQARSAGMPSVFAHALLPMGFMSQFLVDWLRGGRLTRLAVRFVKLVWPGDVLSCKGRVLARRRDDQGRYFVDIDLWAENQKGELVLKGHSTGQIYYNAEDESRQKRGEGPLIVDVSEQTELPRNAKGKPSRPRMAAVRPSMPPPPPMAAPVAAPAAPAHVAHVAHVAHHVAHHAAAAPVVNPAATEDAEEPAEETEHASDAPVALAAKKPPMAVATKPRPPLTKQTLVKKKAEG